MNLPVALVVFLTSFVKPTEVLLAWRLVRPLTIERTRALYRTYLLSVVIPARGEKQRLKEFETVNLHQQGEKQP